MKKSLAMKTEFVKFSNIFFSNTVSNLNIPETEHSSKIIEGIDDTVSIAIEKYKKSP